QLDRAFELFERLLAINPDEPVTLNSYAAALADSNQPDRAFGLFERSLAINSDEQVTLTSYATALADANQPDRAFELFERSLAINPDEPVTLTSYAAALADANQPDRAFELFERSLAINPDEPVTLTSHAILLEKTGNFQQAIENLQKIPLDGQKEYVGFMCLNLGRLYYRIGKKKEGAACFDLAVQQYSGHAKITRLITAKNILAVSPYDEDAIEILWEIAPHSPNYKQALQLLSLNLDTEAHFAAFNDSEEDEKHDLELLNRGIYHKIQNEISILKGIVQRIAARSESAQLFDVIEKIEVISEEITRRRNATKSESEKIPAKNYQRIIKAISDTAHDISDFVNNEIAVIKIRVQRILKETALENNVRNRLNSLLEQIEFTESALNDLKAVNESVDIRVKAFKVKALFENWRKNPQIENAVISLDICNGDSVFDGDEQKIKAFVNELVDNAIRHNSDKNNLQIGINARDIKKLPEHLLPGKTSAHKKYLFISFSDNGKGIQKSKKNWIFLPLKTTSEQGSGLGLFIIKKTLRAMKGYIVERGEWGGCRFEIYIPYRAEQWMN
ncbi:MAG: tetratricopeptide repeat protein, partial [Gammaproteobacteria bacterium]|nr:tetratricopeptide repeat protein [Gammaproteobacteria bacterium]